MEKEQAKNSNAGNVMVVCRVRPLNRKELEKGAKCCLDFNPNQKDIAINMTSETSSAYGTNKFQFDAVFDTESKQKNVYDIAARPIIDSVLDGFNGTIFAYGQTSSGKTHTMVGPNIDDVENQGIIPRMVRTVFNRIENASEEMEFSVKVAMCEIYNEKIKDLFDPKKDNLKIHEEKSKGVYIQDITERWCNTENEIYALMKMGNTNRSVTATNMNAESSRSHSLFILTIVMNNTEDGSCKTGNLFLVDLAGSEKIAKTGAQGQTLEEAKNINKSLTTLGKVIVALTDKKASHVPYRESKLTRILSESLGGNSKTCLIITCSPHPYNDAETLSTLRFGQRARNIKNAPKVNREYSVAELKKLLEKAELKIEVSEKRIKILSKQITDMGGEVPSEKDLQKLGIQMAAQEQAIQEQKDLEAKLNESVEVMNDINMSPSLHKEDSMTGSTQSSMVSLEQYQEKMDKIEQLLDELEQERAKLKDMKKQMADLNEAVMIAEERTENAIAEKERIADKNREYIHKMQNMKDDIQDKELLIQEIEAKQNLLLDEKKIMMETKDMLQKKIDDIYDNNILIARDGDKPHQQIDDDARKETKQMENIHEEIRKLHFQVKQKDTIIHQLKQYIQKNKDLDAEEIDVDRVGDPEIDKILLSHQQDMDQDTSKRAEKQVIDILCSENMIAADQITQVGFSTLLSPQDLVRMLNNHNKLLQDIQRFEENQSNMHDEVNGLKKTLQDELAKEQPNIKEITDKIVKKELEQQEKVHNTEKEQLQKDLHNRIDKVIKLELQLEEVKDAYKQLEHSISKEDLKFKQKSLSLEKNLEKIHQMYQNVTQEKGILKVDLQVLEKKLQKKEDKIATLEKSFLASRQKQQDYLSIIKQLKQEFLKVQSQQMQISQLYELQGGQNGANQLPGAAAGPGNMFPANKGIGQERKTVIKGGGGRKNQNTPRIRS